jgi:hypothetical protein
MRIATMEAIPIEVPKTRPFSSSLGTLEPLLKQRYPAYIPFTKVAVELRGLRAGPPRPPLRPVDPSIWTPPAVSQFSIISVMRN